MKERLNWREACEVLGCSKSTLYRLVANGQLQERGPVESIYPKIMGSTVAGCNRLEVEGPC